MPSCSVVFAAAALAATASAFAPSLARPRFRAGRPAAATLRPYLEKLIGGKALSTSDCESAFDTILSGADAAQVASLLCLLRAKGETAPEIAGMVAAMNNACVKVASSGKLLDIVGTGGDGAHTINISTGAAILAAACGAKVAKAGNRSVSSKCGSADVLEALGIEISLSAEQMGRCVDDTGLGFLYAPVNHPAMKTVVPIRKSLGLRTAFNLLGPMTNAASAQHVLIGVFEERLVKLMAESLKAIGKVEHGVVVWGVGLDEISPLGAATILEIRNTAPPGTPRVYDTKEYQLDPLELGVPRCTLEDLRGGDAAENAVLLRETLSAGDHDGAKRDAVVLNAAMGLYVYDQVDSIAEGVKVARDVLHSGKALEKLDAWAAKTQELAKSGGV